LHGIYNIKYFTWCSSVGIVTTLDIGKPRNRGSVTGTDKRYFSFLNAQTGSVPDISSRGVKLDDHFSFPSESVKNEGSLVVPSRCAQGPVYLYLLYSGCWHGLHTYAHETQSVTSHLADKHSVDETRSLSLAHTTKRRTFNAVPAVNFRHCGITGSSAFRPCHPNVLILEMIQPQA
jgi:hypothetical protein